MVATKTRLTVEDLADLWQLSARTVYDLARSGKLVSMRIGNGRGALRFDPADVERFERDSKSAAAVGTDSADQAKYLKL